MNSESLHQTQESLNSQFNNYDLSELLEEVNSLQLFEETTKLPSHIKMSDIEENIANNSYSKGKLYEQYALANAPVTMSPTPPSKLTESILSNKTSDSLIKTKVSSEKSPKQIPDYPPFVCYLHGLTEDDEIMDIGLVFMSMSVKFTEIKLPSKENPIGSIIFKERSDLVTAIEKKSIKINDVNVILSLSTDDMNTDDENIEIVDEKSKELIQPVQYYIPESLVPIYPPYKCYLYNLPKNTLEDDIITLFEGNRLVTILLSRNQNVGYMEFKSRNDFISVIRNLHQGKIYKIQTNQIIISLKKDYIVKYKKANQIPQSLRPSTLNECKDILLNQRTTSTKPTMTPITRSSTTVSSLSIDQQNIPLNPPFLIYLYNIPHHTSYQILLEKISLHCQMMNFDVVEVKFLFDCYSVEFKKRSDLILAIEKNNFILDGIQFTISMVHTCVSSNSKSEANIAEPSVMDNLQLQQDPPVNHQQFQQNIVQHPQLNDTLPSFEKIELIPNSPPNPHWVKLLNLPINTPTKDAKELAYFFKTFSITLVRIIFLNNGICFCQFLTYNEMIMSLKLPLTMLFIFGMPIAIAPVTVDEATFLSNSHNDAPLTINNDDSKKSPIKSVKGEIISLADQLDKLSGKINDEKKMYKTLNTSSEVVPTIGKENPFRGLFNQNIVDNSMIYDETILNNTRGRTRNQRNSKGKGHHRDLSQHSNKTNGSITVHQRGKRIMPWSNKLSPILIFDCCKCKSQCNLTCSSCGFFYCSIKCQQNDWAIHKHRCRFPQLISSAEFHEKLKKKLNINQEQPDFYNKTVVHTNYLVPDNVPVMDKLHEVVYPMKQMIETPMVRGQINVPHCNVPKPGATVFISAVLDGKTLFIRSADSEDDHEYMNNISQIAEYANCRSKPLIEKPLIGQVILAPFIGNLERAMVLKQKNNLLAVAFIDFGNVETVKFDGCRDLSGNLQMLKSYIHKVTIDLGCLANISNGASKEILNSFKGIRLNLLYKLPFTNSTLVDLVNPISETSLKKLIGLFDVQN